MTNLYKILNILKLAEVHKQKVAKNMDQLHINKLLKLLYDDYVKINNTHNCALRQEQNKVYFKPRINKSMKEEMLVYEDFELWKNIDEFRKPLNWPTFKEKSEVASAE